MENGRVSLHLQPEVVVASMQVSGSNYSAYHPPD